MKENKEKLTPEVETFTKIDANYVREGLLYGKNFVDELKQTKTSEERNLKTIKAAIASLEDEYFDDRIFDITWSYSCLSRNHKNTKEHEEAREKILSLRDHYKRLAKYFEKPIEDEIHGNHETLMGRIAEDIGVDSEDDQKQLELDEIVKKIDDKVMELKKNDSDTKLRQPDDWIEEFES